jgi:hypothetical protein
MISESDAQRLLSMQKKMAKRHGTRFTITGIADPVRSHTFSREATVSDLILRVNEQETTDESMDGEVTDEETDDSDGDPDDS